MIVEYRAYQDSSGPLHQFLASDYTLKDVSDLYLWLETDGRDYEYIFDDRSVLKIYLVIQTRDADLALMFKLAWGGA